MESKLKTCTKCKADKERKHFNKQSDKKDGLQDWCKTCRQDAAKKRRLKNCKDLNKLFLVI
jgi:hypothetical protein